MPWRRIACASEMDFYLELFRISQILLSEQDYEAMVQTILRRLLACTGAGRGFIVVRGPQGFHQAFDVDFPEGSGSREQRRFSRTLVREAMETRGLIHSPNLAEDSRFADLESVLELGHCAALAAPLVLGEEVYGCVYLERLGRRGFSEQTCRLAEEFCGLAAAAIHRALEHDRLRRRNRALERDLFARFDFDGIVTQDPTMLRILDTVGHVADSDASILILGETGTGKELIAQALHLNSSRRSRPFVTVNCAALPGDLLEAELFGHTAGAFTGARKERPGRIAAAEGGTLFLDEVGEIPLLTQAKLLRFLQFGEIQQVGADRTRKVDVRIVSATHRDLPALIERGEFREDLYYRLRVLDVTLPALRDRADDVHLLLDFFLKRHWKRDGEPRWTSRARAAVSAHPFPGNIRELEHLAQRICLLARGVELDVDLLPEGIAVPPAQSAPEAALSEDFETSNNDASSNDTLNNDTLKRAKAAAQERVERAFLDRLMQQHSGNVSQAARAGGFHRTFLQKLLARHGLSGGS